MHRYFFNWFSGKMAQSNRDKHEKKHMFVHWTLKKIVKFLLANKKTRKMFKIEKNGKNDWLADEHNLDFTSYKKNSVQRVHIYDSWHW